MSLSHVPFYASLMGRDLSKGLANQSHVLVYGAIEAHSMGDLGCIASNKKIGEETGLSPSRVASIISELHASGWVFVTLDENHHRMLIEPKLTLAIPGNPPSHTRQGTLATAGNIEHSNRKQLESSTKVAGDPAKEEGFYLLVEVLGFNRNKVKFTPGRKQKLAARLKSSSMVEVVKAAEALARSPWHMGENPNGVKYGTIDFLLRNDETIEKWASHKSINPANTGGVTRI